MPSNDLGLDVTIGSTLDTSFTFEEENDLEVTFDQTVVVGSGSGGSGGDLHEAIAFNASTVTRVHNFGKYPAVQVKDSTGRLVEGDVQWIDINTVKVDFSSSFGGTLILN